MELVKKGTFFLLLTNVKSKRLRECKEFVGEEDSDEIVNVFSKKKAPSILGTEKFVKRVKEKYSDYLFQEEIPEIKVLVPGKGRIKLAVCKVYKVGITSLYGIHRGTTNEPRNVAIYLTRLLRHDSLKKIGKDFKIPNYSSVSSIVESMKANLVSSKKLKKQVDKIKKDIQLSQ